jgi:hypothetical protein
MALQKYKSTRIQAARALRSSSPAPLNRVLDDADGKILLRIPMYCDSGMLVHRMSSITGEDNCKADNEEEEDRNDAW